GVKYPLLEGMRVGRADDLSTDVPADGESMGEILLKGNVVMKGYLKDEAATEAAFADGWFRSGDLAVVHPSGYAEIKDRAKDIIISGGENISTVEVESSLYRHAAVLEASVVARPDEKWGEVPCAFVVLKEGERWGDGVDEAAGLRDQIEDFVHKEIVPSGNRVLVTSRPEGVQLSSYSKTFVV
ncbi:MAG: AMP-binding enzyme, partial [Luminiphilus sp.]